MIITVREIQYRNLNKIDNDIFEETLKRKLHELTDKNYEDFVNVILEELNKVAPVKTKTIINKPFMTKNKPFMTKKTHKAIMTTSRLEYHYRKKQNWGM